MCFFLYIASPLTLSEIRSMLPAGLTADLATSSARAGLQRLHPPAKTVAQLLVGACSCDLVRPRLADQLEDERELRARYQRAKLPRTEIIKELEHHRRRSSKLSPEVRWAEALSGFVVEHARNAGPTLYFLDFAPAEVNPSSERTTVPKPCPVGTVRLQPKNWLSEGVPTLVA